MIRRITRAHVLLLATALVWGAMFTLVKGALVDASPLLFNFLRMLLAAAVLVAVNRRQLRSVSWSDLRAGLLVGLFLASGYELQTVGLAHTTAIKSAFITGLLVVLVPALTLIPRLRPAGVPRPGMGAAVGAIAACTGLLLLTTPAGTALTDIIRTVRIGDLLTLACAFAFAAHLLTLGRVAPRMHPGMLATLQIGASAVLMLFALPLEPMHLIWTTRLMLALTLSAVLATAAGFTIQSYAQQHLPPTHTALLLTLEPLFAWLTSLLLLGEHLDRRGIAGALLILAGICAVEFIPSTPVPEIPA